MAAPKMKEVSDVDLITVKFDALKEVVNAWQQTIQFNIVLTWTILGFVVAAVGTALYFLAKYWVNVRVETEMKTIKDDYEKLINDLDSRFIRLINENPQIDYQVVRTKHKNSSPEMMWNLDGYYTVNFPNSIQVLTDEGKRFAYEVEEEYRPNGFTEIRVRLKDFDQEEDGDKFITYRIMWIKRKEDRIIRFDLFEVDKPS